MFQQQSKQAYSLAKWDDTKGEEFWWKENIIPKALTTEDTERVVQFLLHFAEDQVRVLLGTHVMTVEMSVN